MAKTSFRFAGAYQDPITVGYPLGHGYRWYLPSLMRFIRPDDFSPFGAGGINPYIYCVADPVNRVDPTGHVKLPLSEKEKDKRVLETLGTEGADVQYLPVGSYPHLGEPDTEPFKDKRLYRESANSPYKIVTRKDGGKKEKVAEGIYLIVVLEESPDIAFVRRQKENLEARIFLGKSKKRQMLPDRGHSSIGQTRRVRYAGELEFDEDGYGQLESWNNQTGHYLVGHDIDSELLPVAMSAATRLLINEDGSPLLDMSFFKPFSNPAPARWMLGEDGIVDG
jgi:RHS repeat-associated protein